MKRGGVAQQGRSEFRSVAWGAALYVAGFPGTLKRASIAVADRVCPCLIYTQFIQVFVSLLLSSGACKRLFLTPGCMS